MKDHFFLLLLVLAVIFGCGKRSDPIPSWVPDNDTVDAVDAIVGVYTGTLHYVYKTSDSTYTNTRTDTTFPLTVIARKVGRDSFLIVGFDAWYYDHDHYSNPIPYSGNEYGRVDWLVSFFPDRDSFYIYTNYQSGWRFTEYYYHTFAGKK